MRARFAMLVAALGAVLGACQPDIGSGAYYCGPERACPPDLVCDDDSATCVFESQTAPFACDPERNVTEPDDSVAAPFDAGNAGCGPAISQLGCTDELGDADHLRITTPPACQDQLTVELAYSIAFVPLTVDILDADGNVLAAGEVCDDLDLQAQVTVCATLEVDGPAPYLVRVQPADGAPDCDGTCGFNRYLLTIF